MNINKELKYAASYMPPPIPIRYPKPNPNPQPKQDLLYEVTALANSIKSRLYKIDSLLG